MRINYTTYDVRRKQDTINPRTPHRDVMVLANNEDTSEHPFLYARVLGIFHANVVYTGSGSGSSQAADYTPRRYYFLWVRWFELDPKVASGGWGPSKLDRLRFPPMKNSDSFDFLDPADVVRSCHIVPTFRLGRCHKDHEKGLSHHARDRMDWRGYYLNR